MGDPASELNICNDCGHRTTYGEPGKRPRHSPTLLFEYGRYLTIQERLERLQGPTRTAYDAFRAQGLTIRAALEQVKG
jgi:hypothetical protein